MKAENLPFADGEFDVATAIEVLEHVPDPEPTVAEMARAAAGHPVASRPRAARGGRAAWVWGVPARAGPRARGPRDGARGRRPPARVGSARAAVARAEHGA